MIPNFFSGPSIRRAAIIGCSAALLLCAGAGSQAAAGPFSGFNGRWSGTGKVRTQDKTERIRCKANYRVGDSSGHEAKLDLTCKSDTYSFDLVGDFQADASREGFRPLDRTQPQYRRHRHRPGAWQPHADPDREFGFCREFDYGDAGHAAIGQHRFAWWWPSREGVDRSAPELTVKD